MITDVANNDIFFKSRIKFICLIECVNLIEILLTYSNYEKVTRVLRGSTANLQNKSEKRQLTYRGTIRGSEYIWYLHFGRYDSLADLQMYTRLFWSITTWDSSLNMTGFQFCSTVHCHLFKHQAKLFFLLRWNNISQNG